MNCNVIQDLMMLYADNCCCDESKTIVEEHIKSCEKCRKAFEEMQGDLSIKTVPAENNIKKFSRINDWRASVMQSVLLFVSFALLTLGVAFEASTPIGDTNGLWAIALIIPVTGFLLSLANWYFIRIYSDKKTFSNCSLIATLVFILAGYVWALIHYNNTLANMFNGSARSTVFLAIGCVLSIALCIISRILSEKYARMTGKE
ncbi:MAG: zf-HC2 domain-containing protein [Clostridia bacterium]|nr:zf-HC2 domain-containing protein [Clostridia bacterium]